jgi:membrane protease YdiL (CAAX protease family)
VWRDKQFGAALLAAPLFWAILFFIQRPAVDGLWPWQAPGQFLLLVILYPVLEEIVFRGGLQSALYRGPVGPKKFLGLSAANFITSVVFVSFHFIYHPAVWAALVLIPSLVFGYFRDKYLSVTPAIVLHVFYNVGYYWLFKP